MKFRQLMYDYIAIPNYVMTLALTQNTVLSLAWSNKVLLYLVPGCRWSGCGAVSPGQVRHRVPHLAPRRHEPPLRREVLHQLGRPGEAGLGAGYTSYRGKRIVHSTYIYFSEYIFR